MSSENTERQINIRGEIIIDGPARLIGSFTGTIAEGRIITSGNVAIGDDADVHASIDPESVSIQPGTASLTYVPAPAPLQQVAASQPEPMVQPAPFVEQAANIPAAAPAVQGNEQEPPTVSFPQNQPQHPVSQRFQGDTEDNAARQARARLAAYSRKATGTDDPSGWASS